MNIQGFSVLTAGGQLMSDNNKPQLINDRMYRDTESVLSYTCNLLAYTPRRPAPPGKYLVSNLYQTMSTGR